MYQYSLVYFPFIDNQKSIISQKLKSRFRSGHSRFQFNLLQAQFFKLTTLFYLGLQKDKSLNLDIIIQGMTNNKLAKKVVSFGTQFSSTDIYYESEELNNDHHQEKVEIPIEKEEEHLLSQNQARNYSSASKQSKDEKKSLNHNFQKHAVVTIKKLMKMKYNPNACVEEKIAHRMWNIFMVTDIKSKKLLVILFGAANLSDERNKRLFVKCGFEEIINEQQIHIRKAQEILRKRFIQTVNEQVVQQNIQNFRNIKATQEFLIYFTQLLNLIRKGPLLKLRINDKTAKKIQAEIVTKKALKPNDLYLIISPDYSRFKLRYSDMIVQKNVLLFNF